MKRWLPVAAGLLLAAVPGEAARQSAALDDGLRRHITVLASDAFEGREPGSRSEAKTLRYIAGQWFAAGLVSGTNDPGHPWFAPVELVRREPERSFASFSRGGRSLVATPRDALVLTSDERNLLRDTPLVFLGQQPAARAELAGRIAVVLDSLSGGADQAGEQDRQQQLLSEGAAAVVTVLDGGRGLEDIGADRRRAGYALASDRVGGDLEAYISPAYAAQVFGPEFRLLAAAASRPGFKPRLMPITGTLEATTRETRITTHNVIARLPGRRPQRGAVLLTAHWDHFGICAAPPAEDLICNGAVDNASGVAALIEIARLLAAGKPLDRDVYFVATTAEELGLLGAHALAADPPLPREQIVAAFNIDSPALARPGQPLSIVGAGRTSLDGAIAKVAKAQRRSLVPSPAAEEFVARQDGWALLQHDIPAVMVASGYADRVRLARFMDTTYHRPSDEAVADFDLRGATADALFHVALVRWFASTRSYPAEPR